MHTETKKTVKSSKRVRGERGMSILRIGAGGGIFIYVSLILYPEACAVWRRGLFFFVN